MSNPSSPFGGLNLMESWPFQGLFDAIFCRNVMIYFDTPTKTNLVDRFKKQLKPGGWLYIGHSESLIGSHPGLELAGRTTYRRDAVNGGAALRAPRTASLDDESLAVRGGRRSLTPRKRPG